MNDEKTILAPPLRFSRKGVEVAFHLPQRNDDHVQSLIARHRTFYELDVLTHAESRLSDGELVVDVGAHIGNHTLFFATQCRAHVVCFEPSPPSYELLLANLEANGLRDQVVAHDFALGAGPGRAIGSQTMLDNTGATRFRVDPAGNVEVRALDDVELPGAPRLIKIDVEGMELDVISGARETLRDHKPELYVECQTLGEYDQVVAALGELGYLPRDILGATPTVFFQHLDADAAARLRHADVQWLLHRLQRAASRRPPPPPDPRPSLEELSRRMDRLTVLAQNTERRLYALAQAQSGLNKRLAAPKQKVAPPPAPKPPSPSSQGRKNSRGSGALDPNAASWRKKLRKLRSDPESFLRDSRLPALNRVVLTAYTAARGFVTPDEEDGRGQRTPDARAARRARKLRLDPDQFFEDARSPAVRAVGVVAAPLLRRAKPGLRERPKAAEPTPPSSTAPTGIRKIGNDLPLAPVSLVVVCRESTNVPVPWLAQVVSAIPPRSELVLMTHAAEPSWLEEAANALRNRRARIYLSYSEQSTVGLLRYAMDRAAADRICVVDGGNLPEPAAVRHALERALSGEVRWQEAESYVLLHRAESDVGLDEVGVSGRWGERCAAALGLKPETEEVDDPVNASTALRLGRHPIFYVPRRRSQTIERMVVLGDEGADLDVFGPYLTGLASQMADHIIGEEPRFETFEQNTTLRGFFVYAAPPIEGDLLDLARSEGPVVCCEAYPAWYGAVYPVVRRQRDRVSVVMTCYQDETTVERAIESVLAQTYPNLEVIVVDDHSTDDTFDRVRRMAMHDTRIKLLRSPANRGTYWCKNYGLTHATGDFVTFHDSDDVSPAHRIEMQVAALHYETQTIGVMVNYQRIDEAQRVVRFGGVRLLRAARISLMLRREWLQQRYGSFDSVRVGADDELILRMRASGERLITLPVCGYFARHGRGSLTTGGETALVTEDGRPKASPLREAYWEEAKKYHERLAERDDDPFMPFPLLRRRFEAPLGQSPVRGVDPNAPQRIVASMATMPSRVQMLEKTVARLLPQVDQLNVYLNEFDQVPGFLRHPRIRAVRSQDADGDLKDNGKFYFTADLGEAFHFTVDDDLLYPPDYVHRLVLAIERYERRAVVGVHGVNLANPIDRYLKGREVFHFPRALGADRMVHLLGTGTVAYHTSTLDVDLTCFRTTGVADLWFACRAKDLGVPLVTIGREADWLRARDTGDDNLFMSTQRDHDPATQIAREHGPWLRDTATEAQQALADAIADGSSPARIAAEGRALPRALDSVQPEPLTMAVLVSGWNCADMVDSCWESVAAQEPGRYVVRGYFLDDGSSDGTWPILQRLSRGSDFVVLRGERNRGPAWARRELIERIEDDDTVCVLLDMDDRLAPGALRTLAERYRDNPSCRLTLGNWRGTTGRINPLEPYSRLALEARAHRRLRHFRCPHVRSFRRSLARDMAEELFLDPNGAWLRYCTDVALLLPLLDRCAYEEVELIQEVLYHYTERRVGGTLARFGRPEKAAMHEWLAVTKPRG